MYRNKKGQFLTGNTFSNGNKGGRPTFFESPKHFKEVIESYLDTLTIRKNGNMRTLKEIPSVLALSIFAVCSRETIRATSAFYRVFLRVQGFFSCMRA